MEHAFYFARNQTNEILRCHVLGKKFKRCKCQMQNNFYVFVAKSKLKDSTIYHIHQKVCYLPLHRTIFRLGSDLPGASKEHN